MGIGADDPIRMIRISITAEAFEAIVATPAGIPSRVLDAIQGHAPRTAAEGYGEVTIKTMVAAIERLPRVEV